MESAVQSIIRGTDFGPDFSNDLLTKVDPKSGKTLLELAVSIGRPNAIGQMLKLKPDLISSVGHQELNIVFLACIWAREESLG
jgi:hypothetical protein